MSQNSFKNSPIFVWFGGWGLNIVLSLIFLLLGGMGAILLEQAYNASSYASWFLWSGRLLIASGLVGFFIFSVFRERIGANKGRLEKLEVIGASLARNDVPALSSALTALTQGNLTGRLQLSTKLPDQDVWSHSQLGQSLNSILTSLQECARAYNWITDEPCQRLFYVGTDSFQEGQLAGRAIGDAIGGKGKVFVVGLFKQDNLVLRKNGFQDYLLQKYPGIQVVAIFDRSLMDDPSFTHSLLTAVSQTPDLAGLYATELESMNLIIEVLQAAGKQGRIKLVSHDLTEEVSRLIQQGIVSANISQGPYIQGYDPVIHLYNALAVKWKPAAPRLLIQPEVVTRENLHEYWQIARGAVQSQEMISQRPHAVEGVQSVLPANVGKLLKIAMVSPVDVAYFDQVRRGVLAAADELKHKNVQVDWLAVEHADFPKGTLIPAEICGPYLEELVSRGYAAIGFCIADAGMIPYINRLVSRGVPVGAFTAEPSSLRASMTLMVDRARQLQDSSKEVKESVNNAREGTTQVSNTIQQISKGVSEEAMMMSRASESVHNIANTIQQISRGAQEQSEAAEKVVLASSQISTAVELTTQAIQLVNQSASQSVNIAQEGTASVRQTLHQMVNIQKAVETSAASVQQMHNYSRQIGDIVATIQDIAEQTNLLALNAAIEAARAGEEGRGFAVVAGEVRKLAEKSASATKEIAGIVRNTQQNILETVRAMQLTNEQVQQGSSQAASSGQALEKLLNSAAEMHTQAEKSQQVNAQMAEVMEMLNSSIERVSAVIEENYASTQEIERHTKETLGMIEMAAALSQENAASTEEISASTEEISTQVNEINHSAVLLAAIAEELQSSTARFKLG